MSATNPTSKFAPFSLPLPNNATLSGLSHIPLPSTWTKAVPRPLIVAMHGGTCTAHHYDITPEYTSSIASANTGIPIVSINRPCYAGTSSFLPLAEDGDNHTFFKETGFWLHKFILPTIWEAFAVPNNCAGIVLLSHSLATAPSIITGALYANTPSSNSYTLSGMILSGFSAPGTHKSIPGSGEVPDVKEIFFPRETKRLLMASEPELDCVDPKLFPLIDAQTVPMPVEEFSDGMTWDIYWTEYAQQVETPILYRMGEHDWLWKTDEESMEKFWAAFGKCKLFDSAVIQGGCHALEWGRKAGEWYEMVFQFAQKVCNLPVS
ncbi:hypothetical protein K469DRAFT_746166 [Zopfia rhizophila CBS 207.26]|uniref:AB hydrolase-1 domain-containing protein n=1 Tax=Zopfia rhizophila CBS 207.26 TaxID=1314779 RepID=A0A6A6EKU7_9PEZI|nr:hypothetical protein K469DRAFT_746166 [Zopfia rhizophila CBS 207.26]